jgi:SnoaL-like domain
MRRSDLITSARATLVKRISVAEYGLFFDRFPDGQFENLKVVVAGDVGTFEWDFVTTGSDGQKVRTAGCDLLQFVGDKVVTKNAFRKVGGYRRRLRLTWLCAPATTR